MDLYRRQQHGVTQAFRNDPQLQQFILSDVTPIGRVLGTGSYGSVEEVSIFSLVLGKIVTWGQGYDNSINAGKVSTHCLCWEEAP